MRIQKIDFKDRQSLCVFPGGRSELNQAVSKLGLEGSYPVIVLIGGGIDQQQASVTGHAIQTLAKAAEELYAVVICGGTNMGVMAEIGQIKRLNGYKFPLVGIAPEELVTWPGGPRSTKFMWWGKKRWQLEPHHSHFILTPGSQFGDESPWIVDAATALSQGRRAVTVLINGGDVSRKDIELSLEQGRPVIALSQTGRLADELAGQLNRNSLITMVPATSQERIVETLQAILSVNGRSGAVQSFIKQLHQAVA